jgi:hypothetical protein
LSLFDVHFTVSGVLAINNGMMPQYNARHSSHLTNMPYQHNTKGFRGTYGCRDCCQYGILLHNGNYKKDIFVTYILPQAADIEAEA